MNIISKEASNHNYTSEELEEILEKLEASRGYDKSGIIKKLEEIETHHAFSKVQMRRMLEKLNETDQYAILHYATIFNNIPFWQIMIENYGCSKYRFIHLTLSNTIQN